jgi:hypothetical protein
MTHIILIDFFVQDFYLNSSKARLWKFALNAALGPRHRLFSGLDALSQGSQPLKSNKVSLLLEYR